MEVIERNIAAIKADIANLGGSLFYALCGSRLLQPVVEEPEEMTSSSVFSEDIESEEHKVVQPENDAIEKISRMTDAELRLLLQEADELAANVVLGTLDIRSDMHLLAYECVELVAAMITKDSDKSISIAEVLTHPAFWDLSKKIQYVGEKVGNLLPPKVRRHDAKTPCGLFVQDLEALCDTEVGAYNEVDPDAGGQWASLLDPQHPIGGWGKERNAQQSADRVEYLYHAYGGNIGAKAEQDRKQRLEKGSASAPCEIRLTGMLKFIR